jgi:hypothetical protein
MITFDNPYWLVLATLIGALLLWCKEPPDSLRAYKLADITDRIPNENIRYYVQLTAFLAIGTFAALALTTPSKVSQAFAAGLGWTAGLSGRATDPSSRTKPRTKPA